MKTSLSEDEMFMQRCVQLAHLAAGHVAPNPMVGALLVYQGRIIGEGYHESYGKAHAEINCMESVLPEEHSLISHGTLYVSLEPCSHFGKTPPCSDAIIRQKIKRVVIGCVDPFEKVNGSGIAKLREAGIEVITDVLKQECLRLNKRFFTFHRLRRPYIILKWAQSMNGMIGKAGSRTAISSRITNTLVHKWRSEEAAIMIGHGTAVVDDPQLDNRNWSGPSPVRIILAGESLPENLRMYRGKGRTIVFNCGKDEVREGVEFVKVEREEYLEGVLSYLFDGGIQSLLVEGGAITHQSFFDAGLWDECRIITNMGMMIPDGISAASPPPMNLINQERFSDDLVQYFANPLNRFIVFD